jgi:hypothetical protein
MDADTKDGGPLPQRQRAVPDAGSIRCEPPDPDLLREVLDALREL